MKSNNYFFFCEKILNNMFGQRMKLIIPQQNQKAGNYIVQTSVSDLGIGSYINKCVIWQPN